MGDQVYGWHLLFAYNWEHVVVAAGHHPDLAGCTYVFWFFLLLFFFLTINLSEAYQSSSPTCLFCHLTTPAEMMLSNTHTHTHRCTSHHKQQNTSKRSTNFFRSTIKTQNLSKPVCAWCDSLTAVVYQLHITFLGAKLAKNRDCLLSEMKGGTISLFAILSTTTTTIIFPMCHFWKEQGALTHPC